MCVYVWERCLSTQQNKTGQAYDGDFEVNKIAHIFHNYSEHWIFDFLFLWPLTLQKVVSLSVSISCFYTDVYQVSALNGRGKIIFFFLDQIHVSGASYWQRVICSYNNNILILYSRRTHHNTNNTILDLLNTGILECSMSLTVECLFFNLRSLLLISVLKFHFYCNSRLF